MIFGYTLWTLFLVPWLVILAINVVYVLVNVLKNLYFSKRSLDFYKRQGAVVKFFPILGFMGLEDPQLPINRSSTYNYSKKLAQENEGAPLIVTNMPIETSCVINIHSPEIVKEFIANETAFDKVSIYNEFSNKIGFFFQNGSRAFHLKSVFSKVFRPEGLEKLTPAFSRLLKKGFEKFDHEHRIGSENFVQSNLHELLKPIMCGFTSTLIFGEETLELRPRVMRLMDLTDKIVDTGLALTISPLFNLFPTLCRKLKLCPELKIIEDSMQEQVKILAVIIEEREEKAKSSGYSNCIIDRILEHNRECKEQGKPEDSLSLEDIAGNFNLFQLAGTDTSMSTSKNAICYMADKPEIQKVWLEINKELFAESDDSLQQEVIDKSERLQLVTKEVFRQHSAASRLLLRRAKHDVKLGDYMIRKGDLVTVMLGHLSTDPKAFHNPDKFDPDRFSKTEVKLMHKLQYIPFSTGKRPCLGRYLGELIVQLVVSHFVHYYTFRKPSGLEYEIRMLKTTTVDNPFVDLKIIDRNPLKAANVDRKADITSNGEEEVKNRRKGESPNRV